MLSTLNLNPYKVTFCADKKVDKQDVVEGAAATAGVGATAALAKTGKTVTKVGNGLKDAMGVTKKADNVISAIPKNKNLYKSWFLRIIENMEKSFLLKPLAKLAKMPFVQRVAGVFGGVIAAAFCITDMGNIVRTSASLADTYTRDKFY